MSETYDLERFVQELRSVVPKQLPPGQTLEQIAPSFQRLLNNREFLQHELDRTGEHGDEVHLYEDPDFHFTILARGVKRGQSHAGTPHDHGSLWALYGIYEGTAQFERYELDLNSTTGPFPGLRKISERAAVAGDYDAIEPGNMHLPVFPAEGGTVIIVVYDNSLDSVVRRGYMRDEQKPVRFQGLFPTRETVVDAPL